MATGEPQSCTAGLCTAIMPKLHGPSTLQQHIEETGSREEGNHFAVTPKGYASAQHAFSMAARLDPIAVTAVYCRTL